jgi:hypothetical protein
MSNKITLATCQSKPKKISIFLNFFSLHSLACNPSFNRRPATHGQGHYKSLGFFLCHPPQRLQVVDSPVYEKADDDCRCYQQADYRPLHEKRIV